MKTTAIIATTLAIAVLLMPDLALAQRNKGQTSSFQQPSRTIIPQTYYQPRVNSTYQVPKPLASKDAYMLGGGVVGGVGGTYCCGPYGGAVGGPAGAYAAAKQYDYQAQ